MSTYRNATLVTLFSILSLRLFAACTGQSSEIGSQNDELISNTAVERQLTIRGYVYVDQYASNWAMKNAVQKQIQTAFSPLKRNKISVDDQLFSKNVDPQTFTTQITEVRRAKAVVPGQNTSGSYLIKRVKRVDYTYQARSLADNGIASNKKIGITLLMWNYTNFQNEIFKACVTDYDHDIMFASTFWYVWAPHVDTCATLIDEELSAISQERIGLVPEEGQIGEKEANRRYLPVTVDLAPTAKPKNTYPEYDQLFGLNDPQKTRLTIYAITGSAALGGSPDSERYANDLGFKEFWKTIHELTSKFRSVRVASNSPQNPLHFSFGGRAYGATLPEMYQWIVEQKNFPAEVASTSYDAFRRTLHDLNYRRWIYLEFPIEIYNGSGVKNLTVEFRLLYGTTSSSFSTTVFRQAFRNGDVVIYNGHSYIGLGPLGASNYYASDFPDRYQIFFFNSCVSFNYYNMDFFSRKKGGSQKLDMVTNGIEVYVAHGGKSAGQFIVALLESAPQSWVNVLNQTQVYMSWGALHDPNRVVDGEQDNQYAPAETPFSLRETPYTLSVKNTSPACGTRIRDYLALTAESLSASHVEFLINGEKHLIDRYAPYYVSWNSALGSNGPNTITARAYDACGNVAEDSCTVYLDNRGNNALFFDNMENINTSNWNWTATGLWHLVKDTPCASPSAASASRAFYFGQDKSCTFGTGEAAQGTLTSRALSGLTASSTLTFNYFRDVEKTDSPDYDETRVEVSLDDSNAWETVWYQDSGTPSIPEWKHSDVIPLGAYAGKRIRLRFAFDSKNASHNNFIGWLVDDVRIRY